MTELRIDDRGRAAGKSHDLAWAMIEHLADQTWASDDPARVGAVFVIPRLTWMDHPVIADLLHPYRFHYAVATPGTLERTRGLVHVPWFVDDMHLCQGGLQPILAAAQAARAPFLLATVTCSHVASRGAHPTETAFDWVCTDCGLPDPHRGDLL